ncbi:thiol:disulfide interchange protein TlpA [Nitratireductor thuwali]|uniref:Thiol:disulfide interchange protein TlpA n=1 Tax=Nitratireductor thuwali TaxID=2267699 RepID=A0ABY5MIW1_9HYPH|nr:Thiol:disulfide interchange protein TlpA [Nitratireductor thuwali]
MPNKKLTKPAFRMAAIAAAAGIVAGAIAVYVMGAADGNNGATANVGAATLAKVAAIDPYITGEVAAMLPADPPRPLTDLAFNGPDGQPLTVADFSGKTLLINLWATWCTPCREEMPALDALQQKLGSDAFEVVAVNVDLGDDAKPKRFLEETNITALAHYRDNKMKIFNDLKSRGLALGLPVTLLLDGEGNLLAHMNGPAAWDSADAERLIEAAVATPEG